MRFLFTVVLSLYIQAQTQALEENPLDPLSEEEIKRTTSIINAHVEKQSETYIFIYTTLKEPPKSSLLPYFLSDKNVPKGVCPRKAFTVLVNRRNGTVCEVITNLDSGQLESFSAKDGQTLFPMEDMLEAENIMRADPSVQFRCADLGFANMSLVFGDPWALSYPVDKPEWNGKRRVQLFLYAQNYPEDNLYAHPFDFSVVVDLIDRAVISIEELPIHKDFERNNKKGFKVPKKEANFDYRLREKDFLRKDVKPITIQSPEGSSYTIKGNQVEWQKWKMRLGTAAREGLVVHMVSYNDNGTVRPILYRASLSEMFVQYGDPRPPFHRKFVFDMGEYGLGISLLSQVQGEDVITPSHFLDTVTVNSKGEPSVQKNVVSIREEDAGILWKHVPYRTGKGFVVRSRRLCIMQIATVGNYDYIFNWYFYQDGSIRFQVQPTGCLSVHAVAPEEREVKYATMVSESIIAPYHHHLFVVRLDTEIDGNENSVATSDVVPVSDAPGSTLNPYGQGYIVNKTVLKTALEGRSRISPENARVWLVSNPTKEHPITKQPVSWKLIPTNSPPLKINRTSPMMHRAWFLDYDLWAVPYVEGQIFPAGDYIDGNKNLPESIKNNPDASIVGQDIVLHHVFGSIHVPRVEDYPVMPTESTGFWFKPNNFFVENPGLDVPPSNQPG